MSRTATPPAPTAASSPTRAWPEAPSTFRAAVYRLNSPTAQLSDGGNAHRLEMRELAVEIVPSDLARRADIANAVAGCDAIVHVAGLVKARTLDDYRQANVRSTEFLLRAARQSAPEAVFVLVSSQAAAGPAREGNPVREGDVARPMSSYGVSKREAEDAVEREWTGPWSVLRSEE